LAKEKKIKGTKKSLTPTMPEINLFILSRLPFDETWRLGGAESSFRHTPVSWSYACHMKNNRLLVVCFKH
jgi:hypothetical protein